MLCQEFGYNLLYRWFLDLMEPSFDAAVFTEVTRPQ